MALGGNLEFVINPDADCFEEASAAGDDGSGLQRCFVYLHCRVESRERVAALVEVTNDESVFVLRQYLLVGDYPLSERVAYLSGMDFCLLRC